MSGHADDQAEVAVEGEELRRDRMLVLMRDGGNRSHVIKQLSAAFDVVEPASGRLAPGSFDLAIADASGLKDWWTLLLDAKFQAEPTFLPVVLVLSKSGLRSKARPFWDVIDEFITAPIEPGEFLERISLLLRTRRLALEQRNHLAYVVNHDRVTGLPNKNLFMARVNDAVRDAAVLGQKLHVSVLHLPLSRVLKSFGNHGMDEAAAKASSRLTALIGDDVSIARLTSEEWGLVHRPGASIQEVLAVLNTARSVGDTAFQVDGDKIHLAPRLGVSVYPTDGTAANTLLDRALAALDTTRTSEPAFYSAELQHTALRIIRTEARLYEALERRQLEVWFQPQIELASRRLSGVEALVRWRLPTGELVPPGQFLPVAEETGVIRQIDAWVMEEACKAIQRWREDGVDVGRMSVNVCAKDLLDEDFVPNVRAALDRSGLPPSCLELELTETDLIEAGDVNVEKLAELRAGGVRIAVDDFGTGYSSLAYLRSLPITTLKIDRTFIADISRNDKGAAITEVIVGLATRFGLETVAEGIETEEQAARIASLHVTNAQGFLYGKPMPEQVLREWVAKRRG